MDNSQHYPYRDIHAGNRYGVWETFFVFCFFPNDRMLVNVRELVVITQESSTYSIRTRTQDFSLERESEELITQPAVLMGNRLINSICII